MGNAFLQLRSMTISVYGIYMTEKQLVIVLLTSFYFAFLIVARDRGEAIHILDLKSLDLSDTLGAEEN
jgi:hypothetical protein